ncbi:MAG: AgmX/PglI C-terminal domain-containing protein, partial [Myxococcales bacterium]|nr:AgmX/PglI C-terminal domain-containing protein [Myxococcales bacterium]
ARLARAALALDADDAEAQALADRADLEGPAAAQAELVTRSIAGGDAEAAVAVFAAIPEASAYRAKVAPAMTELRTTFVDKATKAVASAVKAGKCKDAKATAAEVAALWPDDGATLTAKAARCKAPSSTGDVPIVKPPEPEPVKLDKAIVKRIIERARGAIEQCHQRQLMKDPYTGGIVTVKFTVGADGKVTSASGSGVSSEASSCVASVFRKLRFPAPGAPTSISYPIPFRPAEIDSVEKASGGY